MNIKHGASRTPEYRAWQSIKDRCLNENCKNFADYGGRGISICSRWINSFPNFFSDVGERPSRRYSIDRINNNGDYGPYNCKWSTSKEQNNNTRRQRMFYALAPSGVIIAGNSQVAMATIFGLKKYSINRILRGRKIKHRGWSFSYSKQALADRRCAAKDQMVYEG